MCKDSNNIKILLRLVTPKLLEPTNVSKRIILLVQHCRSYVSPKMHPHAGLATPLLQEYALPKFFAAWSP